MEISGRTLRKRLILDLYSSAVCPRFISVKILSERNFCYFDVYTFVDLFVQKIEVDKDYCLGSLVPKLELFIV
jgi:hypothetical protein